MSHFRLREGNYQFDLKDYLDTLGITEAEFQVILSEKGLELGKLSPADELIIEEIKKMHEKVKRGLESQS